MPADKTQVALVMDGSRRHYDLARALHLHGCLDRMFADWYVRPRSFERTVAAAVKSVKPELGRRMAERFTPDVPAELVRSNALLALRTSLARRFFPSAEEHWQWASEQTGLWILKEGLGTANAMYGFIRNVDPTLCRHARQIGLKVIGEQMIAPAAVEQREYQIQQERWPGWEPAVSMEALRRVQELEEATWASVDRVVAPSSYVVEGLREQGIDTGRIDLIPYPAEFASLGHVQRTCRQKPLTVGFIGQVNLRKNAPVFFDIAKRMAGASLRFEMVGKISLNESILSEYARYVSCVGPVPRSGVPGKLAGFDVFFFPSTCEGSAGVVLEAMATGLPIVTTPNSGAPVVDGTEGFVCDPQDIDGFVDAIERLVTDDSLRQEMGGAASRKVTDLTLHRYGMQVVEAIAHSQRQNASTSAYQSH